ncbi:MAG: hypothetical protein AB1546_03435 [bacterium]
MALLTEELKRELEENGVCSSFQCDLCGAAPRYIRFFKDSKILLLCQKCIETEAVQLLKDIGKYDFYRSIAQLQGQFVEKMKKEGRVRAQFCRIRKMFQRNENE